MAETNGSGWIKIYRSMAEKGWANKPDYVALWLHLLLLANHREKEQFWNGRTIVLQPGQFVTGRKSLSEKSGIHESKVERILNCFESEQQIEQRKTSTSRLISIRNWLDYQLSEQPFKQRMNNGRTTSEQRVNTKQEYKEYKEGKKVVVVGNGQQPQPPAGPSKQEFIVYAASLDFSGPEMDRIWQYYRASIKPESEAPEAWRTKTGNPIANWKQHISKVWLKDQKHNGSSSTSNNVAGWRQTTGN